MILDDLGTEMVTVFSTSALYTLINSRLTNGKKNHYQYQFNDGRTP